MQKKNENNNIPELIGKFRSKDLNKNNRKETVSSDPQLRMKQYLVMQKSLAELIKNNQSKAEIYEITCQQILRLEAILKVMEDPNWKTNEVSFGSLSTIYTHYKIFLTQQSTRCPEECGLVETLFSPEKPIVLAGFDMGDVLAGHLENAITTKNNVAASNITGEMESEESKIRRVYSQILSDIPANARNKLNEQDLTHILNFARIISKDTKEESFENNSLNQLKGLSI